MRIIITIIICCGFALCNDLNNDPGISDTLKPRHSQRTIIAAEFTGGFLGGVITGTLIGYGSALVFNDREAVGDNVGIRAVTAFFLGASISYPFGAVIGTYWAGSSLEQGGNFFPTLTGALLGVPVMWGLFYLSSELKRNQYLLLIPALAFPPLGAVIGYNLSRPKSSKQQTLYHYLNPPTLGLRTEKSIEGETITYLDFKLINAKF